MTKISLTADELLSLLTEKKIQKDNITIYSNASYLSILSMLELQRTRKKSYVKFKYFDS